MNSKFTLAATLSSIAASQGCIPNSAAGGDCGYSQDVWNLALELSDANYIQFQKRCEDYSDDCPIWNVVHDKLHEVKTYNDSLWQGFLNNFDDDLDEKLFSDQAVTTLGDFIKDEDEGDFFSEEAHRYKEAVAGQIAQALQGIVDGYEEPTPVDPHQEILEYIEDAVLGFDWATHYQGAGNQSMAEHAANQMLNMNEDLLQVMLGDQYTQDDSDKQMILKGLLSKLSWDELQYMEENDLADLLKEKMTIDAPAPISGDEALSKCIAEQSSTTNAVQFFDREWTNSLTDCLTAMSIDAQIQLFGERALTNPDYKEKVKMYLAERMEGQNWDQEEIFFVIKYHLQEISLCVTTDGTETGMPGCEFWY